MKNKQQQIANPNSCPRCESLYIKDIDFEATGFEVIMLSGCNDCHFRWTSTYTISNVNFQKKELSHKV